MHIHRYMHMSVHAHASCRVDCTMDCSLGSLRLQQAETASCSNRAFKGIRRLHCPRSSCRSRMRKRSCCGCLELVLQAAGLGLSVLQLLAQLPHLHMHVLVLVEGSLQS